jgi:hypothetical protein
MPLKVLTVSADYKRMSDRRSDRIVGWVGMAIVWLPASPFLFAWLLGKWWLKKRRTVR